jgi:double-stranded uracil-DNA glycosylase
MLACFSPISDASAQTLILGSFPGVASLTAVEYYRHPRNAFWPIMADVFGFASSNSYLQRCERLKANKIALWDVIAQCQRKGSLDSAIEMEELQCNDFANLLGAHPKIERILFNGAAARKLFEQFAMPMLANTPVPQLLTMPSTSPAFAAMRFEEKLARWKNELGKNR